MQNVPIARLELPSLDFENEMALTQKDWGLINAAISAAVEPPRGWKKLFHVCREWGVLGANFTVIVALLAFAASAMYQSRAHYRDDVAHVEQETAFRTKTIDALERIQADLRTLQAVVSPLKTLTDIARLPNQVFANSLPALRTVVTEHRPQDVAAPTAILQDISAKLTRVPSTAPQYWGTVLQFLRFASASMSAANVPPPDGPRLVVGNNKGVSFSPPISRKVLVLDGGELLDTRVENSRVIFTNNPVRLLNVTFVNCVFEIPVSDTPPQYIQRATQQLLASGDLRSVSLSVQ